MQISELLAGGTVFKLQVGMFISDVTRTKLTSIGNSTPHTKYRRIFWYASIYPLSSERATIFAMHTSLLSCPRQIGGLFLNTLYDVNT